MPIHVAGTPIGARTIFVAILASMGGFLFGYDSGQISGIQEMPLFIQAFSTEPGPAFNSWLLGLIVSSLSIGTFIGVLLGAPLADRLGRRMAMSIETLVFSLGVIIQVTAFQAWWQVAIGRGVSGLGVGALSAVVPVYMGETVPSQLRGSCVACYQLFITLGILVSNLINLGTREIDSSASWRVPIAVGIPFAAILGLGIWLCPESPRWLISRGRNDQAYAGLGVMRGHTKGTADAWVEADYAAILAAHERDSKMRPAGWADCFRVENKTLHRTLLGVLVQALQQLTGANFFFYFGPTIFQGVGVADPFVVAVILGAINVFCTFIGLYALERFGRRIPLIVGAAGMAVWLIVFATAGTVGDPTSRPIGTLLIVAASFFILFYASTWAPGAWLFIGESFSGRTRAKQAALGAASNWAWNFMISFFTTPIVSSIDLAYGYVFAGCMVFATFFAYFFVYETKDLQIEQVDEMYNDPAAKPWNSRAWVPAGYTARNQLKEEKSDVLAVEDPQHGEWRSKPDPVTGEERDTVRKHKETPQRTQDA